MGLSLSEHALDTGVHLLFFNKLAALGCRDSFFHGGNELGLFTAGSRSSPKALRYKFERGFNLFPRHVVLFHHLVDAHVLEVLENGGHRHPGVLKHPCSADFAGNTFDRRALRPIETCHVLILSPS
jgi:hypothetical protein